MLPALMNVSNAAHCGNSDRVTSSRGQSALTFTRGGGRKTAPTPLSRFPPVCWSAFLSIHVRLNWFLLAHRPFRFSLFLRPTRSGVASETQIRSTRKSQAPACPAVPDEHHTSSRTYTSGDEI